MLHMMLHVMLHVILYVISALDRLWNRSVFEETHSVGGLARISISIVSGPSAVTRVTSGESTFGKERL